MESPLCKQSPERALCPHVQTIASSPPLLPRRSHAFELLSEGVAVEQRQQHRHVRPTGEQGSGGPIWDVRNGAERNPDRLVVRSDARWCVAGVVACG